EEEHRGCDERDRHDVRSPDGVICCRIVRRNRQSEGSESNDVGGYRYRSAEEQGERDRPSGPWNHWPDHVTHNCEQAVIGEGEVANTVDSVVESTSQESQRGVKQPCTKREQEPGGAPHVARHPMPGDPEEPAAQ